MLETVANNKNKVVSNINIDNNNNNNNKNSELHNLANNKINDDITALKQTDANHNEAESADQNAEKVDAYKKNTNIDEEIVESVSQLESVITKTIENTKNLEDVADIEVDQPEEDLLSEVLRPLGTLDDLESAPKSTDNLNLNNAAYESPNELDVVSELAIDRNNKEFRVAEVMETTRTPTSAPSLSSTTSGFDNTPVVNVHEKLESFSDITTPFSVTSNSNKIYSSESSSSLSSTPNHGHTHHHSSSHDHDQIEITTTITNSHSTPAILTDSTTTTTTTSTTTTSTPIDTTFSTLSTTSLSSSSSSSSSSSPSSSAMFTTVAKKVKCVLFYNAKIL